MYLLETDRLYLRNLKYDDLEIMYDYRNNEICAKYQRNQTKDKAGLKKLIEERKNGQISVNDAFILAVVLKSDDEMIGEVVVIPKGYTISMGYTISYKYHRKGYAYEILDKLTEYLHQKYPQHEFICFVDPRNTASINLLEKLGYVALGYDSKINSNIYGKWLVYKEAF